MKRQRGRGRKPSNPNNRSYESNGPDVKIRGNANQIYEKYLQYARDAQTSGDRVGAEAYYQHAEHYFRIVAANAPKDRPPQMSDSDNSYENRDNRDDNSADDNDDGDEDVSDNRGAVDAMAVVDGDGEQPEEIASEKDEEEKPTRRRGRRPSRRPSRDENKAEAKSDEGDDAGLRAMMARSPAPEPAAEQAEG